MKIHTTIKIMGQDVELIINERQNEMFTKLIDRDDIDVNVTLDDVRMRYMDDDGEDWSSTPYYSHKDLQFVNECIRVLKDRVKK